MSDSRQDFETRQEAFIKALSNAGVSPSYQGDGVFTGESRLYEQVFDAACKWQASRQAFEVKPFTWVFTDVNGKANEIAGDPVHRSPQDLRIYTALYTHPARSSHPF